jgi:hypothetical protein
MRIADEARPASAARSPGARCGEEEELFTDPERPGDDPACACPSARCSTRSSTPAARSRSHALAWCVRLVGDHEGEWIDQPREAMVHVEKVRSEGPGPHRGRKAKNLLLD